VTAEEVTVEGLLQVLEDLVALVLAAVGIGAGVLTALGRVQALRQPVLRLVATIAFVVAGLWVFYIGIQHMGSD
jgi:hypothetical protein